MRESTSVAIWSTSVDVATVVLALAAVYLAWKQWSGTRFAQRVDRLGLLRKIQSSDSPRILRSLADRYPPLHKIDLASGFVLEHMVLNREHVLARHLPLIRVSDVKTILRRSDDAPNKQTRPKVSRSLGKILPRPSLRLAGNLAAFTDDRSYDAPTFALARFPTFASDTATIDLEVKVGTHFDFIDGCMSFGYEATNAAISAPRKYAIREKYALSDLGNRHAQIGVVTMVVVKNVANSQGTGDYFLLHRRSAAVTESANLLNVVPGGTFQPMNVGTTTLASKHATTVNDNELLETIVREFYEEVYSVEEFSELTDRQLIRQTPAWKHFHRNAFYLGLAINPLNAYIELLTIAVIDVSTDSGSRVFGANTFSEIQSQIHANSEGDIELQPFTISAMNHYELQYRSAPSLRQICQIVRENWTRVLSTGQP